MEMSFWYMALVGGLVTWTTCTFLRAVATRTRQLREQVLEQLVAAREVQTAESEDEEVETVGGEPGVAAVMNVPKHGNPAGKNGANGKPRAGSNGKGNGHAGHGAKRGGR